MRALVIAAVSWFVASGCGDEGHQATPYASFQACFDEHAEDEGLTPVDAIASCCLEHPIDNSRPACGASSSECINYLTINLNQTSASFVEVQDACYDYEGAL